MTTGKRMTERDPFEPARDPIASAVTLFVTFGAGSCLGAALMLALLIWAGVRP